MRLLRELSRPKLRTTLTILGITNGKDAPSQPGWDR